ncbi:hypothetical protein DLM86_00725 [Paenibacillus flagellatus]|uniref:Helix-turn-helix domain-containing protein n=1 Tax=Paenibacillus flagellatus TaxID=2211139 RepID=A0A2V5KBS4_9BACL|nr:hypothetical protein DLM86_00725 [Paenibacillus flagellatus]
MLTDCERKVLRVLHSLYGQAWSVPDIKRICRFTLRREDQVRRAITGLIEARYVELRDGQIRVIHGSELIIAKAEPAKPSPWLGGLFD